MNRGYCGASWTCFAGGYSFDRHLVCATSNRAYKPDDLASRRRAAPTFAFVISLHFSQSIEASFSELTLSSFDGERIALKQQKVDGENILVRMPLTPLDPGEYLVEWTVLTHSGVPAAGEFRFRVDG
ncbi:methionine-rich copper-binding protein CopC [Rhizobium leguminosarum]|uniref:Methionine-rich copper-binding protein CopC n=1 Tax=Rhizobium leguminosarum TaxID=384 RepID=A0AAE2ML26_RHILE|nr:MULTISPECIES: copper resistance protein CopC [Rhizobium]MBB4291428.1 methionine-rich copper-binding protein CopC [Rhizobium leguminosarum]MBB4296124.1 methionine-rich copper-binding protein CopC [Rhizobium leguminosarum]MBB4308617.1 methionine-rich copper-binding protein CopC [Rhizobium leguminosarum]MBB4416452.1 methionine-rich copper-binding protein CopC [Rhizobium leguminosarum]MBB4430581.1 methionine-rich copper-binding protein CopC [Rhizobium esperanzae]